MTDSILDDRKTFVEEQTGDSVDTTNSAQDLENEMFVNASASTYTEGLSTLRDSLLANDTYTGSFNDKLNSHYSFSPTDITGLEVWFDASDANTINKTGTAVTQWDDKSTNGNNATQGSEGSQPVHVDGTNYVTCSGDNMILDSAITFLASTPLTIFWKGRLTGSIVDRGIVGNASATHFLRHNNATQIRFRADDISNNISANTSLIDTDYSFALSRGTNTTTLFRNNVQTGSDNSTGQEFIVSHILSRGDSNHYLGRIYQILIYNTLLTDDERAQVFQWLETK